MLIARQWPMKVAFAVVATFIFNMPAYPAMINNTPSGEFASSKGNNKEIEFLITVESDPGDKASVFWAQQFEFENGTAGYLGLQRVVNIKKIIFSIWDARGSVGMMSGAKAERFTGEGEGEHVLAPFDWQLGHTYRFQLAMVGATDSWWSVAVSDVASGKRWDLGKIQASAGAGTLGATVATFTEVFWGGESCQTIPYARATFGSPEADQGQVKTIARSAYSYGKYSHCALSRQPGARVGVNVGVRSDLAGTDIVHQIGLSNGPQHWGDFSQHAVNTAIFRYANPHSSQIEYFGYKGPRSKRYGYFPINAASNIDWQYLGIIEPFYNSAFQHATADTDEKMQVGQIYGMTQTKGITRFFRLIALTTDKHSAPFPTDNTDDAFWKYIGTNIGK
jgi:hypothetical protein